MAEDGSGSIEVTVTADAEVVEAAPDLVDDLRLDDLQQAGWNVDGPTAVEGGGLQVVLSHPFASTEEATALLGQLSGDGGLLAGFELDQQRSFARVGTELSGSLTFEAGLAELADADIVEQIGGAPYVETLADRGIPVEDAFGLRLVVTAPGDVVDTNGTPSPSTGNETTVTWEADLVGAAATEAGQPVTLRTAIVDEDAQRRPATRTVRSMGIGVLGGVHGVRRRSRRGAPTSPPARSSLTTATAAFMSRQSGWSISVTRRSPPGL